MNGVFKQLDLWNRTVRRWVLKRKKVYLAMKLKFVASCKFCVKSGSVSKSGTQNYAKYNLVLCERTAVTSGLGPRFFLVYIYIYILLWKS